MPVLPRVKKKTWYHSTENCDTSRAISFGGLDERLRDEVCAVAGRHDEELQTQAAKLQDTIQINGENHKRVQRRLELFVDEEHAQRSHLEHRLQLSFSELDQRCQVEIARVSNEHHRLRQETNGILKTDLQRFDAELRKDMADMARVHVDTTQQHQADLREMTDTLDQKHDSQIAREVDERCTEQRDLREGTQRQLDRLVGSLEDLETRFARAMASSADLHRKENQRLWHDIHALKDRTGETSREVSVAKSRLAEVMAVPVIHTCLR